ncbi:MAG TPA: 2-phospho-L-lactate guanylyltransferase [Candidatus Limnocylindrales bacterium]|nr:2-phospho-L-lactate guanylyltransferase [Candidatus Limnocylindrales bacterium]
MADLERTWALVPLRGLEDAKTRLGAELDAEERLELVVAMASRTLAATRDAAGLAGTVLVTADPAAAELAEAFGARTLVQRLPGLNAALREARTVAVVAGATAVLVVPIDLPAISAAAIGDLLAAAQPAVADPGTELVVAVPDRHGTGTNALLVSPPETIQPAFGEGSFEAHRRAARTAGAAFLEVRGPLTVDVDTGADLLAAEAGAGPTTGRG